MMGILRSVAIRASAETFACNSALVIALTVWPGHNPASGQ